MNTQALRSLAAVGAVGAAVALPAAAGAVTVHPAVKKSISIALHAHIGANHSTSGVQHGHGTITGALPGTYTATVDPPLTTYVLKVKGGTIDISVLYNVKGTALSGTWHTTGGSGTYKHVKGTGKATGALATNAVFKLSGTLSY